VTFGIYIHVPFCQAKCSYCHFLSVPFHGATADRYGKSMIREIQHWGDSGPKNEEIDSVYFGGGTPSLVPAELISEALDTCRSVLAVSRDCEVSLESNPGTVSAEKAVAYLRSGVNRVSIGAQSFDDRELTAIGRLHSAEMISESISRLRTAGFVNLNLDLMLGLPGQTADTWRKNLESIKQLAIPHISVYMLDMDEICILSSMVKSGSVRLPDDDLISDLYLETIDVLARFGYQQYEISNFALPGHRCRHNLKYWLRKPVHGFGLGSHSFDGSSRYSNYSQFDDYFEAVESGRTPVQWREAVTSRQSLAESLFLGLRLTQGVNWNELQSVYGCESIAPFDSGMREMEAKGLVEWNDSTLRLTSSGMLLSNEIFQLFI
jgi:oxygen-independent coproporphyrinogen III oxidase